MIGKCVVGNVRTVSIIIYDDTVTEPSPPSSSSGLLLRVQPEIENDYCLRGGKAEQESFSESCSGPSLPILFVRVRHHDSSVS